MQNFSSCKKQLCDKRIFTFLLYVALRKNEYLSNYFENLLKIKTLQEYEEDILPIIIFEKNFDKRIKKFFNCHNNCVLHCSLRAIDLGFRVCIRIRVRACNLF